MLDMIKHILYVLLVVGRAARWSQEGWTVEESLPGFPFWAVLVLWIFFEGTICRILREKIQPTSGNHHIWKINILIRSHQVNMWSMIIHLLYFNTQGWQRILTSLKEAKVLELGPQVHFESKKFGSPFFCGSLLVPFLWFRLFLWIKNGRANERTDY